MRDMPVVDYASPRTHVNPWRVGRAVALIASAGVCAWYWLVVFIASLQAADWKRAGAEARTGISVQYGVVEKKAEATAISTTVATGWCVYTFLRWRRSAAR